MSQADSSSVVYDEPSINDALVHLARLSLAGRQQDVAVYLQRTARRLRASSPEIAAALTTVLRESPTRTSPLRSASSAPLPVDGDSRLPLLRIDEAGAGQAEPILDSNTRYSLHQIINERRQRSRLLEAGLAPSRASLFIGPPGLGKTMAAQWIAGQLGVPLAILDLSSVMSSLLGKTGMNLRHAFDYAKQSECVLLLDELDAIGKRRGDDSDVGELKRLVTVLLQQIDDWPESAGLILGATNHPELLDPAVWRRFDTTLAFPEPDAELRSEAIERFAEGQLSRPVVQTVALATPGASFNDLERLVMQIRRSAVITDTGPDRVALDQLEILKEIDFADRLNIARDLADLGGLSQRRISSLTGISRDTLRKHL